jgi:hypothetical protein
MVIAKCHINGYYIIKIAGAYYIKWFAGSDLGPTPCTLNASLGTTRTVCI